MSMRIAVCPGSFDPPTLGHVNYILRAARLFDRVYVLVCDNSVKKSLLSAESRVVLLKDAFAGQPNIIAESYQGLLAEYVVEKQADVVVKGVRNAVDFAYEHELYEINRMIGAQVGRQLETILMPCAREFFAVSSSMVRDLIKFGKDCSAFVPNAPLLAEMLSYADGRR